MFSLGQILTTCENMTVIMFAEITGAIKKGLKSQEPTATGLKAVCAGSNN